MKKLITKLANLFPGADKIMHILAGLIIGTIVLTITGGATWFGFAAAFLAGLYKEFVDHNKVEALSKTYVKNSYLDWVATILGGLLAEGLWLI